MSDQARLETIAREWGVAITSTLETATSLIAYGGRGTQPVVLKLMRRNGDESRAGEVLEAFAGPGVVRVYAHREDVLLLERLIPGTPLVSLVRSGNDEEATDIIADVIRRISPAAPSNRFPTVQEWSRSFERYAASGDRQIPPPLVAEAHGLYLELCASQRNVRLLHGDLHHYNVLYDDDRGWVAIDPKGVIGEIEYELGACLRNPFERPDLLSDASVVQSRVARFAMKLHLDPDRVLAWAFSQAVLSAIWSIEDDVTLDAHNPAMLLARTIRPLLADEP